MSNCTVHIANYPLASPLVSLSLTTEQVGGRTAKILIDMTSRIELLPTAVLYFENNNLLPESLSKAGLCETLTYTAIQQISYYQQNGQHLYQLQLTIPTT